MTVLHVVLAWTAVVGGACLLITSLATGVGIARSRLWLDRAILVQAATAAAASMVGALNAVLASRPPDGLHLVYGAVLVAGPLAVRYGLRDHPARRIGRVMTVVAVIGVGVLVRSFMTGG